MKFHTDIVLDPAQSYDFCVTLESDADIPAVTVKLTENPDVNFYRDDRHDLTGGSKTTVVYASCTGKTLDGVMLVLDFGGAPAGTTIEVKDVILQTHRD